MSCQAILKPQYQAYLDLWIPELESGRWPKGIGFLTRNDDEPRLCGHCCLGVLCELAVANPKLFMPMSWDDSLIGCRTYTPYGGVPADQVLPEPLRQQIGFATAVGTFALADMPTQLQAAICTAIAEEYDYDDDIPETTLALVNDNTEDFKLVIEILKFRPVSLFMSEAIERIVTAA